MVILFWLTLALCFYGYIGYPLLLLLLYPFFILKSKLLSPKSSVAPSLDSATNGVSILVAAYNEEANIIKKLDSLLAQPLLDVPLEILVLNDGSSDGTAALVTNYSLTHKDNKTRIRLLDLERGGKAAALNQGVEAANYDIVVFSDADNRWDKTTLQHLLDPFKESIVGAVSGQLVIDKKTQSLGFGDRVYRLYESVIRRCETAAGSAVSADGGIFAIRKSLFDPVPADVTDDFYISTGAIAKGHQLRFVEQAIAFDEGVEKIENQYRRRIRVTVRGMRSLMQRKALMNPMNYGFYAIQLISHKLIRRFTPFFALLLLPLNALIADQSWFYLTLFVLQLCFYAIGIAGLLDKGKQLPKPVTMVGFLLLSSFALGVGVVKYFTGLRFTQWSPENNR